MNINLQDLSSGIKEIFIKYDISNTSIEFFYSNIKGVDVQLNSLLQISDNKNINEIKNEIIKLLEISEKISAFEISKNGFINITFSEKHLKTLPH